MNQLMTQTKRSFIDKLMSVYYRRKLGLKGNSVMFDSVVHLMRYPRNIRLGSNVYLKFNARLCPCNETAEIAIGNRTTIGYNTLVFASESIKIGKDCMIAPNVYLVDSDHGSELGTNMNAQANVVDPIVVEDDVWIGTGAVILKGARIAKGCIIAANSVVKDCPEPHSIYAGGPAKRVGRRK
jgi:acetyltransferase-like isoleucine patch superfamily enzyme